MEDEAQQTDLGADLRPHLFHGDLLQLPPPDEGRPEILPVWFSGPLPALIYPPLSERGVQEGENINLEISPYNLYYGALRELAETADEERSDNLRRLVLEWNPQAALEVCELARLHVEQNVEVALLHYELAMELDENLYEAAQDAGMCEYALAAVEGEESEERLANAEELFRRAIELRPDAGLSWWSLARVLNDQDAGEQAAEVLGQFLRDYPQGDNRDLVEQALTEGFEAGGQPSPEQAAFTQAQAMAFGGDPAGAVELLRPLAEAYPDTGEIWFVLGAAHRRLGDTAEAERCLRRTVRLAPEFTFGWWELSGTHADAKQWREAEEAIRTALEHDPENAIYLCDLGRIRLAQGDREGAEEAIHQARDLVPDDPAVEEALKALEGS